MTDDRTLRAASTLAALETLGLILIVLVNSRPGAPLFIAILGVKLPFCVLVRRRSAGAFLALLLYEVGGLVGAVIAPAVRLELRLAEALVAAAVLALLAASARLFPSPELPQR